MEQFFAFDNEFLSSNFKATSLSGHLDVLEAALYATESLLLILDGHGSAEPKLLRLLFSFRFDVEGFGVL